jgi:two-component system, NarL family, sensor histidine kinase LiaS
MQWPFLLLRKLRWQLSLSYILVVVVTIPTLLAVGLAAIILTSSPTSAGLSPSAQLVQSLETNQGVQMTAKEIRQQVPLQQNFVLQQFLSNLNVNVEQILGAAIIDSEGKPLALYGVKGYSLTSAETVSIKTLLVDPQAQNIIRAAFANDQRLADLTYTFADGRTIVAVPLLESPNHPLGVFFMAVSGFKNGESVSSNPLMVFFSQVVGQHNGTVSLTRILPSILLLILVISIIGTLFGVLSAHRITHRLQRITSAVHAWSRGKFQATVHDNSPDELGQLARDLNQMAQQVQILLETRQEFALMEERQRVARDLHDSVKQHAFAITLLIGAARTKLPADPAAAQIHLIKAEDLADHIREELTTILQHMRPPILAQKGLTPALQDYVHQWSQRTGVIVEFSASGVDAAPLSIEEALFRVAQEALANVARHSQAKQVQVKLEQKRDQISLMVSDNGRGFELAKVLDKGQGLANMNERVEAHQGSVSISSTADGTLLEVCIPFSTDLPAQIQKAPLEEGIL